MTLQSTPNTMMATLKQLLKRLRLKGTQQCEGKYESSACFLPCKHGVVQIIPLFPFLFLKV